MSKRLNPHLTREQMTKLKGYVAKELRCCNCDKVLKPYVIWAYTVPDPVTRIHAILGTPRPTEIVFYGYDKNQKFCTKRCGYALALAAVKAGYVRSRPART